jgi:hypothetical protein
LLFELRMYHCGLGRVQDVANRLRDFMPPEFRKHGVPPPLGQWEATSGPRLPIYVWMLAWPDLETRNRAFAALWANPDWQALRARTNGAREMVTRYDILLMSPTTAAAAIHDLHGTGPAPAGLHELRVYDIWPGRVADAVDRMRQADLPALKRAGAITLGLFEVQSGGVGGQPALAHFLIWPDYPTRERGLVLYEADPAVEACNRQEVAELKSHVLGRRDIWLMRPSDFCPPRLGLAPRPWYDTPGPGADGSGDRV